MCYLISMTELLCTSGVEYIRDAADAIRAAVLTSPSHSEATQLHHAHSRKGVLLLLSYPSSDKLKKLRKAPLLHHHQLQSADWLTSSRHGSCFTVCLPPMPPLLLPLLLLLLPLLPLPLLLLRLLGVAQALPKASLSTTLNSALDPAAAALRPGPVTLLCRAEGGPGCTCTIQGDPATCSPSPGKKNTATVGDY
jgi:hypothetical protein